MIGYSVFRKDESATLSAERIEADAAPEPRRSRRALAREGYDEGGGLTNPEAWRLHRDVPEPNDPWRQGQIQCERCEEYREPHCTHGRQLCAECSRRCESCACEEDDAAAIADRNNREWWD